MPENLSNRTSGSKTRYSRLKIAATVIDFEKAKLNAESQRDFARKADVPRTTLQGWIKRLNAIPCDPEIRHFCESPVGYEFIHRIVTAAQYTFSAEGDAGIRQTGQFLKLSGLNNFVASSYGSLQKSVRLMEENIIIYGDKRQAKLAQMPPKNITICEDETFFPDTCLVAIEPVSGFIFLEEFSEKRDAKSWNDSLKKSIGNLPVNIIQSVSDEAKGIISHVNKGLGAHHSPDLFHILQDIHKGTGPSLRAQIRHAVKEHEDAVENIKSKLLIRYEYSENIDLRGPGRPPNLDKHVESSYSRLGTTRENILSVKDLKEAVATQVNGISTDYHPIDLATGKERKSGIVKSDLEQRFEAINVISDEIVLPEKSQKKIRRAENLVPKMAATIAFFWKMVEMLLADKIFSPISRKLFYSTLIPLSYLKLVQNKAPKAQRKIIENTIVNLMKELYASSSSFSALNPEMQAYFLNLANQCAEIFQRSSSCVEGRNGALSLHHHARRGITPKRLQALTVIHNFGIKRDGMTAAERLSGIKQPDLFEWLLTQQPLEAKPILSKTG